MTENPRITHILNAPVRGWVELELERGKLENGFYIANFSDKTQFVGKVDETDQVFVFPTQPIKASGWEAKLVFQPSGSVFERDYDGEWIEYTYGCRPMVAVEGEGVKRVVANLVEISGFRFTDRYVYNDPTVVAAVWFQLCRLSGLEPALFRVPNIYKYWADPTVIREGRFVDPKRTIVQESGRPLYELVNNAAIVEKPLHRTFIFQDGTKVQLFVNVASWRWPRMCSQRGQTWIESWEPRYAWRLEAMVSCWRGAKPCVDIPDQDGREWHSFTDPWVLKSEPERVWWPLLDLIRWFFVELPTEKIQLISEDGTRVPVLQELPEEPAWDRPPIHQLTHEDIEGGVPKINLNRIW